MIEISTDKNRLDINVVHQFLTNSYWAKGRTMEEVKRAIDNSLNFGVYLNNEQIGFARICTDYTVFVYLMDLFILLEHQGKGYSKELIRVIVEEPSLKTCKVWMIKTMDAHGLYRQFSFTDLKLPEKLMERILK
jgi:GNAT superfamily N-acetyltransferase